MNILIADSRADLDVLAELLEGEYEPDAAERRNGLLAAIPFGIVLPLLLAWAVFDERDGWTWEWLIFLSLILTPVAIGAHLFIESRATYFVKRLAFGRRALVPPASWTVALEEIAVIDLHLDGDAATLILKTTSDRRRKFKLRAAAQNKLVELYPQLFGKIDYSALPDADRQDLRQFHTRLLRKSVILAVGSVVLMALVLVIGATRKLPPLADTVLQTIGPLFAVGLGMGVLGAAYSWYQRKLLVHARGTDARLPVRYRWFFYSLAAALIVAVAATMFVLAGKGLVTWR